jgi:hypothetical protein
MQAGSPILVTDPFGNIDRLRDHIAAEMIYTRELYKKNDELQKDLDKKQKIIVSLSMRYLLEKLPGAEIPSCGKSGTEKWQYIWTEAWNNAELASEKEDRTHPLHEVMQQLKLLRKGIYECGL